MRFLLLQKKGFQTFLRSSEIFIFLFCLFFSTCSMVSASKYLLFFCCFFFISEPYNSFLIFFFTSIHSITCLFSFLIISITYFSMTNSTHLSWLYNLISSITVSKNIFSKLFDGVHVFYFVKLFLQFFKFVFLKDKLVDFYLSQCFSSYGQFHI